MLRMMTLAMALTAVPASAESLREMLARPSQASIPSQKSMNEIEHCVAVGMSEWVLPVTIRGERRVEIYGTPAVNFQSTIYLAVTVSDTGSERQIEFRTHKAWKEKTETLVRSCA